MPLPHWIFPRIRSFWFGFTLPLAAARVIFSSPSLILLSLFPLGITVALYVFIISRLQSAAHTAMTQYFLSWGWSSEGWKAAAVLILTKILLFIISALTFSLVASVAASPFNDFLAERSEPRAMPPLEAVPRVPFVKKLRLVAMDLGRSVAATTVGLAAILFSWAPILNLAALVLTFLLFTFQYVSYPQTRRGEGLGHGIRFLWRHLFACAGFGFITSLLFAIPILSSLSLPLAVVGGTLLYARAPGQEGVPPLK